MAKQEKVYKIDYRKEKDIEIKSELGYIRTTSFFIVSYSVDLLCLTFVILLIS
jgi:hypothetical protein